MNYLRIEKKAEKEAVPNFSGSVEWEKEKPLSVQAQISRQSQAAKFKRQVHVETYYSFIIITLHGIRCC